MWSYAVRRFLGAIPTLFIIITLAFFMMRIAPGGPFDSERRLPPEIEHNIKAAYNLDKPVYEQYFLYLGRLAHFDLGPSFKNKDFSVTQLIEVGLPVSAKLGLTAMVLAILFGISFGTVAALNQNKATDYTVMTLAMVGITIPTFVTAPILTLIFGVYGVRLFGVDLSLPQTAIIARLVRGSMVEVLRSNYVRTARAKGLPNRLVVFRHALRAALLPVVSYLGPAIAGILTGSLIVENIFGIPGIGRYFINGALNRDYTLVMGVVIYYASFVILLNLLADILYAALDPRVRLER